MINRTCRKPRLQHSPCPILQWGKHLMWHIGCFIQLSLVAFPPAPASIGAQCSFWEIWGLFPPQWAGRFPSLFCISNFHCFNFWVSVQLQVCSEDRLRCLLLLFVESCENSVFEGEKMKSETSQAYCPFRSQSWCLWKHTVRKQLNLSP